MIILYPTFLPLINILIIFINTGKADMNWKT